MGGLIALIAGGCIIAYFCLRKKKDKDPDEGKCKTWSQLRKAPCVRGCKPCHHKMCEGTACPVKKDLKKLDGHWGTGKCHWNVGLQKYEGLCPFYKPAHCKTWVDFQRPCGKCEHGPCEHGLCKNEECPVPAKAKKLDHKYQP